MCVCLCGKLSFFRKQGVVLNKNGATVGEVLGDGLVLSFSSPSVIQTFDVCLRLSVEPESYKVADFGYSTEELKSIYPLGLDDSFVLLILVFFCFVFVF